ncbi:hypothetical protein [Actinomadura sp. DC4]|uniref:hypothetical protein n=1 Tax=Actinomadura sp. DC4 TaxID=3055069 RepID=UPI0025B25F82|nr:hypothetical protein [Actinomadura sp. DC4]MDN3358987.1 hypothetical protein [Actinomadura sp. DC4]
MADDDAAFGVQIGGLKAGAGRLRRIGELMREIEAGVNIAAEKGDLGGEDKIGKALREAYGPAAKDGVAFVRNTADLLERHGAVAADLGVLFGDVNDTATENAGTGRKG